MKKCIIITILLLTILFGKAFGFDDKNFENGIPYEYITPSGSIEELYKDIIVTFMEPYINQEIEMNYGQLLQYDLFQVEFLDVERPEYRSFNFKVKIQVKPFVGAHNTIGIDEMVMNISTEKIFVESFKHIKSFEIPPYLK